MSEYIDQVFGPEGLLAAKLPGYEARPEQIALAKVVDQGFREGRHVLAEAPCGTGKTLAYGVPAIAHAACNKFRTVIATANIQLQEQIVRKDLPFLQNTLPWSFSFALLKGRNNYFCQDRPIASEADGTLERIRREGRGAELRRVLDWAHGSQTGDKSELSPPTSPAVWSAFSVDSEGCHGRSCGYYDSCFYEVAKAKAWESNIVVTNYHMLFAHVASRTQLGQDVVLPGFDLLVLDEAHSAADIARQFFGFRFSRYKLEPALRWLRGRGRHTREHAALQRANEAFFHQVAAVAKSREYKIRLRIPLWDAGALAKLKQAIEPCINLAVLTARNEEIDPRIRTEAIKALDVLRSAHSAAEAFVKMDNDNLVYWINELRSGCSLEAKMIEVGPKLERSLFPLARSVVMTSATLATGGNFNFVRTELGVPNGGLRPDEPLSAAKPMPIELAVSSPFNFPEQGLLVIPEGPEPKQELEFQSATAHAVEIVARTCHGRTMALFTSKKNMNAVHELLARRNLPYKLLVQSDAGQRLVIYDEFRRDEGAILLGLASFWTGVDIPGEALSGLVIDKLPFPNLSDPLVDAINEKWKNSFQRFSIPSAIMTLKQGVGRLIRRKDDYGVVVVVDPRMVEHKAYAKQFLLSLPPMASSRDLADVEPFITSRRRTEPGLQVPQPSPPPEAASSPPPEPAHELTEWRIYIKLWAAGRDAEADIAMQRDMLDALYRETVDLPSLIEEVADLERRARLHELLAMALVELPALLDDDPTI